MKKVSYTVLSLLFIMVSVTAIFADGKETPNYLKGCIVRNCIHTRKGDSLYCDEHKCAVYDCTKMRASNDKYCSVHKGSTAKKKLVNGKEEGPVNSSNSTNKGTTSKSNTTNTGKKISGSGHKSTGSKNVTTNKNPLAAYDEGYEDIWLNDDYDWDRYYRDPDYADGIDDAMEDEDW